MCVCVVECMMSSSAICVPVTSRKNTIIIIFFFIISLVCVCTLFNCQPPRINAHDATHCLGWREKSSSDLDTPTPQRKCAYSTISRRVYTYNRDTRVYYYNVIRDWFWRSIDLDAYYRFRRRFNIVTMYEKIRTVPVRSTIFALHIISSITWYHNILCTHTSRAYYYYLFRYDSGVGVHSVRYYTVDGSLCI